MTGKLRIALRKIIGDEAQIMGFLFGILTLIVILSGIFVHHRLGTVDSGKYEKIMKTTGLTYTEQQKEEGDLLYVRVVEQYDYTKFSYSKLFTPIGSGSIVYPITLIRLLTKPFGLSFFTIYLYFLYSVLTAAAVYMIVRSAAYLWGNRSIILGIGLALVFSDRNLTAYFGSLYEVGTFVVALALFGGFVLRGFTYYKGNGSGTILPVILSSVFLLNADSRAIVFVPVVLLAVTGLMVKEWEIVRRSKTQVFVLAFILFCAVSSSVGYFTGDPDNNSDAAVYHAVFQGILPVSENPEEDLKELGLDASFLEDIGKSFYQGSGEFVHDPKDEREAGIIFSAINTETLFRWYLKHPIKLLHTVLGSINGMNTMETGWTLGVGQSTQSDRKISRSNSLVGILGRMFLPEGYGFMLFTELLVILLAVGFWVFRIRKKYDRKTRWIEPSILISSAVSVALYLPLHVALMGTDSLELDRVISVSCLIATLGGLLLAAGKAIEIGSVWFREIYEENIQQEDEAAHEEENGEYKVWHPGRKISAILVGWGRKIADSRRGTVLAVFCLAVIMVCTIEFANPRAGSVNNGDYGRWMDQLGLIWMGDIFYDVDSQLGSRVIEEYAYLSDFDPATLTFLKPTYSLVYPVAIVRGICTLFDLRFSTWYVAWVMSTILVLCILSIVRDLYSYLGKYTLLLGVAFCLILLCESYLVWFNSLFGEGSIFLGLMMVLACSVHLAVLPQGKGIPWVFALAFASVFTVTAKAQMMVALPVLLTLVLIFAFYHRPLHVGRLVVYLLVCLICVGVIGYSGIQVYKNNGEVSDTVTVWQSVFFGALMISDDPAADMEELGIPLEMIVDIGKNAYLPDEEYVISPNSEEAKELFYNRITQFTMVRYYLKRPAKLLQMLDYSAGVSQELYNGFRVYLGQNYSGDYDVVDRWGMWLYWRPIFALAHFWEYVLVYGTILGYGVYKIMNKEISASKKLLIITYLSIMLIGAFQYPLTTIGNGFADNHKQMFGFMLCHDLLVILGFPVMLIKIRDVNSVKFKLRYIMDRGKVIKQKLFS